MSYLTPNRLKETSKYKILSIRDNPSKKSPVMKQDLTLSSLKSVRLEKSWLTYDATEFVKKFNDRFKLESRFNFRKDVKRSVKLVGASPLLDKSSSFRFSSVGINAQIILNTSELRCNWQFERIRVFTELW